MGRDSGDTLASDGIIGHATTTPGSGALTKEESQNSREWTSVQRSAKVGAPGCVNAAGKLRQKW